MTAHAQLAPSSASRWLECPYSSRANVLPREAGPAAHRGTDLHASMADALTGGQEAPHPDVAYFVRWVRENWLEGTLHVEAKLFDPSLPEFFGTPDVVIVTENTITVLDLKTGDMPVSTSENQQLMCYLNLARGVYGSREHYFGGIGQFGRVEVEEFSSAALDLQYERVQKAAGSVEIKPGAHCRYCPLLSTCKQAEAYVWAEAAMTFDEAEPTAEDCLRAIQLEPVVAELASRAKKFLTKKLLRGDTVEGWRLGQPLGNRKWQDPDVAASVLLAREVSDEIVWERNVRSPAQIEKLVGDSGVLDGLIVREAKPVISVPEDSRVPKYDPTDLFAPDTAAGSFSAEVF